ncbi:MAG: hypothetical protein QNK05_09600 [Myxococcota bacterium]|nr:hypothetical protein [Myxococcota bacterium]
MDQDLAEHDAPESDGRRRRSQRTREHILQVLAETLEDPTVDVSIEQIAARSGFSVSTVLRLFRDQQGLVDAMRELVRSRVMAELNRGPFQGDRAERVDDVLSRLSGVFETMGPVLRAMLRRRRMTEYEDAMQNLEKIVRGVVGAALDPSEEELEILSALLSASSWNHLRSVGSQDPEGAARILRAGVLRVLG